MRSFEIAGQYLRYRSLIWNFAERELRARFKGTVLGWVWSTIVPLATLGLYTIVFGVVFRAAAPPFGNGHDPVYGIWLFTGLVVFNFFASSLSRGIEGLQGSTELMRKISFPAFAPVLGALIATGVQSVVESTIALVVLALFGNVAWTWLLIPVWALLFCCFAASFALIAAIAALHLRDMTLLVVVALQFLFFATPIMYQITMVPEHFLGLPLRWLIAWSPLARFVEMFRLLSYDLAVGEWTQWIALVVCAVVSVAIAVVVVNRFGRDLAEVV